MQVKDIAFVIARLCFIEGLCLLLPLACSLYYGDGQHVLLMVLIAALLIGSSFSFIPAARPDDLSTREGFLIVSLSWTLLTLFGCIPFMISGFIPSFTDAFFEVMSGFTTTGATILQDVEILPRSLQVWRHMTQWLGGMGVIALAVAVLPVLGVGGAQLFKAEVPGPTKDRISPRISDTAKILWAVYLVFTGAEIVLLVAAGIPFFDALCISFTTMATGGFAPLNASIAGYPSALAQYVIVVFMVLAGTNFSLHYWALKGRPLHYFRNPEFRLFVAIIGGAFVVITGIRLYYGAAPGEELVRSSLFQTVSMITTTGFVTQDYELWPFSCQFILVLLMFVGGCAGSTGGAMKNVRILVLFKYLGAEVKKLFHPHGVFPVKMEGKLVPEGLVSNIMAFLALYMLLFLGGVLALTLLGENIDTAIGAVAATLGNVGPGIGNVGAVENYSAIPPAGKWVLSFLMLAGRLEIYTVLVLFMPRFWK